MENKDMESSLREAKKEWLDFWLKACQRVDGDAPAKEFWDQMGTAAMEAIRQAVEDEWDGDERAPRIMVEWLPIDSAPTDTEILCCAVRPDGTPFIMAVKLEGFGSVFGDRTRKRAALGWGIWYPTHWMPLLAPPSSGPSAPSGSPTLPHHTD